MPEEIGKDPGKFQLKSLISPVRTRYYQLKDSSDCEGLKLGREKRICKLDTNSFSQRIKEIILRTLIGRVNSCGELIQNHFPLPSQPPDGSTDEK